MRALLLLILLSTAAVVTHAAPSMTVTTVTSASGTSVSTSRPTPIPPIASTLVTASPAPAPIPIPAQPPLSAPTISTVTSASGTSAPALHPTTIQSSASTFVSASPASASTQPLPSLPVGSGPMGVYPTLSSPCPAFNSDLTGAAAISLGLRQIACIAELVQSQVNIALPIPVSQAPTSARSSTGAGTAPSTIKTITTNAP